MKSDLKNTQKLVRLVSTFIIIALVYSAGFYSGRETKDLSFSRGKLINKQKNQPKDVNFDLFWQAWKIVDQKYAGKTDEQKRVYGAISGMLGSLDDPYTSFFPPVENDQFQSDLNGSFEGIGAEISIQKEMLTIVAPLEGSPAEKAGLQPKDIILSIDKKSTESMGLTEAVSKIRGKAGTEVTLSILREDWKEPKDIKVKRDKITMKSVKWEMKEDDIAYIKISQFGEDTEELLNGAIDEIKGKNPKGLIVDLRNNPGGLLNVAIDTTSIFVEPGVVVQREYKDGKKILDKTTQEPRMLEPKMVVLINEGSASASEIFAGALQDRKRATLIGKKTFGKGSVQDYENLTGGAALKITTAKWLTANGRPVNGKGIEPDIKVDPDKEDNNNNDTQLKRALEELK